MSNFTTSPILANRAITVPFHGAELYVVEKDGQPHTPMKPIVVGMGLDWKNQHAKLASNQARWGMVEITIPSSGGPQAMSCIPLRKFFGWVTGIHVGKIREEIRAKVLAYQNECDDVLWQYWNDGLAINPRAFKVNPGDELTHGEQDTLRQMLQTASDRLPRPSQGKFLRQGWSKLKSHFGVSYRQIPREEFTNAVSIVTRHIVDWEVLDAEKRYDFPLSTADVHDRFCGNTWLTPARLLDPKNRAPELELIERLEQDGYDVMGAKIRIIAMREALEQVESIKEMLRVIKDRLGPIVETCKVGLIERGKNVSFSGRLNPNDAIDRLVYGDQIR